MDTGDQRCRHWQPHEDEAIRRAAAVNDLVGLEHQADWSIYAARLKDVAQRLGRTYAATRQRGFEAWRSQLRSAAPEHHRLGGTMRIAIATLLTALAAPAAYALAEEPSECNAQQQAFVDKYNRRGDSRSYKARCEPMAIVAYDWVSPMKLTTSLAELQCRWIWEDDFNRAKARKLGFKWVRAEYGGQVFLCPVDEGNQSAKTGACKPVDTLDRAQALGGREIRKRLAGKDEKLVGGAFSTGTQERVGEYWYLRARTTETAYMVTVNAATCKVKVRTCREAGGAQGACYVVPTTDVASRAAKQAARR